MNPTKQQNAVYHKILRGDGHILVNAKAGTGKTFTISTAARMVLEQNPGARVLFLAFNKAIQEEAQRKLPDAVEVRTCHSKGLQTIRGMHGVEIDTDKCRRLTAQYAEGKMWSLDMDAQAYRDKLRRIASLCDLVRMTLNRDVDALAYRYGIEIEPGEATAVLEVAQMATDEHTAIDMVDMIYRPAVFDYKPEQYDYVFVDECQDLTASQQRFVKKLCRKDGVMVFVGDPGQAIYGFAGADSQSFERLREIEGITELPLSKSFRCGKNIIRFANKYNPDIEAFDTNIDGVVDEKASISDVRPGDMVLSRLTMPLVSLCYRFIGDGIKAHIKGRDVGENLIGFVKKSGINNLALLDKWMNEQLAKTAIKLHRLHPHAEQSEITEKPAYIAINEQIAIVRTVILSNPDIMDTRGIENKIRGIFTDDKTDGIMLCTMHKAKGLENDRVFIVDWESVPLKYAKQDWEIEQERNLQYVAATRAKRYLGIVTDWKKDDEINVNTATAVLQEKNPFSGKISELLG